MNDRAVIFDMDGVLVNSYRAHFLSWQRMAAEHGRTMTEAQFAAQFGRTSREIIASLWADAGGTALSPADIAAMDDRKEALYREILAADFPAMPGARELLLSLHAAGFKLAIGSSGPPQNVRVVVECLDLPAGVLGATVDSTQVTRGKPDPQVFLLAAGKLGVPPARCAVVEDAPAGLRAAAAAGMTPIAITGTAPRETLASLAAIVIEALVQLSPKKIAKLIGRH